MNPKRIVPLAVLLVVAAVVGWSLLRENPGSVETAAATPSSSTPSSTPSSSTSSPSDGAGSDAAAPSATTIPAAPTTATPTTMPAVELPDLGPHPELVGIDGWLQSDIDSLDELDGTVYAVQFWTYGCYNCKNTLPHLQELYAKYADQGFEIVGVHSPEFAREAEVDNIVAASADLGVTWPIALDPKKDSFHEWQPGRAVWPRIFIIDRDGHVRLDHKGEGAYAEIDAAVGALLAESA